jgi:hypothetical protein
MYKFYKAANIAEKMNVKIESEDFSVAMRLKIQTGNEKTMKTTQQLHDQLA